MKTLCIAIVIFLSAYPLAFSQVSWQKLTALYDGQINDFAVTSSGQIFAATNNGVFTSSLSDTVWVAKNNGLTELNLSKIDYTPSGLLVAAAPFNEISLGLKIFVSNDFGQNWKEVETLSSQDIVALTNDTSGNIFAVYSRQGGGVIRSSDGGTSWQVVLQVSQYLNSAVLSNKGSILLTAKNPGTIYRSTNNGTTWDTLQINFTSESVSNIISNTNYLFVSTAENIVYRSSNDGITWQNVSTGLQGTGISLGADSSHNVYASTSKGVYKSIDNGLNWNVVNIKTGGLRTFQNNNSIYLLSALGTLRSNDQGKTFMPIKIPIQEVNVKNLLFTSSSVLIAASDEKLFRSFDNGKNWETVFQIYPQDRIYTLTESPQKEIFLGYGNPSLVPGSAGILKSSDNGLTWKDNYISDFIVGQYATSKIIFDNAGNVIVGIVNRGLYRSTDSNWSYFEEINSGLSNKNVLSLLFLSNGTLLAGTDGGGIYRSTNNGDLWVQSNTGLSVPWITSIEKNSSGYLYASSNYNGGIFQSKDNGISWLPIGPQNISITSLVVNSEDKIFAGSDTSGIFESTNQGVNWTSINTGLTNLKIQSLFLDTNGSLYAGTPQGLFKTLTSTVTGVQNVQSSTPQNYSLSQNYPNPFNPTTTIEYSIPKTSFVTLKVYDVLGREVAVLVNQEKNPGLYKITFDGGSLSSGVYFYRIKTGEFISSKKLLFLK